MVLSFAAIKWLHSSFTVRGWHRTKEVKLWHKSAKMPRLNTQCKNVRGDVCHANVKEFWMFSSSGKYRGNKLQICFFCDWKTFQSWFIFNLKQHYCYFYEKIIGWHFSNLLDPCQFDCWIYSSIQFLDLFIFYNHAQVLSARHHFWPKIKLLKYDD